MAKGLGVNKQSSQRPSNVIAPNGNIGSVEKVTTRKIRSRLNIQATPTIKNQG